MPAPRRGYKSLTLQQLRCLAETARLGNFMAAAAALDLSHPTVWKQVHALERSFGVQLVETHARGCYLTAAGRLLVEMSGPPVESIATLHEQFEAALGEMGTHLTIAVGQRTLLEDLAPCVLKFRARYPKTRFTFRQESDRAIAEVVEVRRADFGFTPSPLTDEQRHALQAEPCYKLEVHLIAPKDHPLARRRTLHPRDLRPYPIVNTPDEVPSSLTLDVLNEHGAYHDKDRVVQTGYVAAVRQFVQLGLGIGLVPASRLSPPHPDLHERSMSRHFGHLLISVVRRRGAFMPAMGEAFIRLVRQELGSKSPHTD
jgi:DNA-binding transcriptional LysR family regulator